MKVKKRTPAKSSTGSYDAHGVELPLPPPLPDPSVVINPISHGILFFESSLSPRRARPPDSGSRRSESEACWWDLHHLNAIIDATPPILLPFQFNSLGGFYTLLRVAVHCGTRGRALALL